VFLLNNNLIEDLLTIENIGDIDNKLERFVEILNKHNTKMLNLNLYFIKTIFGSDNINFISKTVARKLKKKYKIKVNSKNTERGRIVKFKRIIKPNLQM